jgi:hypothetical protein
LAAHPALRSELEWGVFWKRSHALLLLAAAGAALSRRRRAFALLALPYANHLRASSGSGWAAIAWAPYSLAHDATEIAALARGSVRSGTFVL